jgi:hypothetical protein
MFIKSHKINILLLIVVFFYACNTAKHVPVGRALLQENYIKGVNREMRDLLKTQIRQQPNRRILFVNKFFLNIYNTFDTTYKKGWLRKKLIRLGEAPVVYDSSTNFSSVLNIKQALFNMGYFDSEVKWNDTLVGKKKNYAKVYYTVVPNKTYTITKVNFYVGDRYLDSVVHTELSNSYIKVNHVFKKSDFDAERARITAQVRDLGYYYFNKEYIYFEVDSTASPDTPTVKVKVIIENPEQFSEHKIYKIAAVYITIDNPNVFKKPDAVYNEYRGYYFKRNGYNIARNILLDKIFIYKNEIFRQRNTIATYEHLNDLQLFRYVNISYVLDTSRWVHTIIHDDLKGDIEFFGDTTNAEPTLICFINMAPTSKYEIVVEPQAIISDQNSIAGSPNTNYGGAMNVLFRNKNILTRGETFQLTANGALAYQFGGPKMSIFKKPFAYKQFGLDAQLKIPTWVVPGNFKFIDARNSNTIFNVNYSKEVFKEFRRNVFGIGYRYQTTLFKKYIFNFSPIDISYISSQITDTAYERIINSNTLTRIQFQPKFIVSMKLSLQINSSHLINNSPQYSIIIGLESSGLLLHQFSKKLNAQYDPVAQAYTLLGVPYSQFYRGDIDLRYHIKLGITKSLASRLYGGIAIPQQNSAFTGVPFEKRFFVGGTNDLRGWRIRKIGPGSFYYDDLQDFYRAGDVKLMFNTEYRTGVYKSMSGALFFDAGNVWNIKSEPGKDGANFIFAEFYKQIAMDAGMGLRYDLDFFVFRFDAAMPLFDPRNKPGGVDKWVLRNINSWTSFGNYVNLNVAIGLPF